MQRDNTIFLKEQLAKSIKKLSSRESIPVSHDYLNNAKYVIEFDSDETQELKTNMDYIKFAHIEKLGKQEMGIDEVCDTLITGMNEMPLWMKLSFLNDKGIFKLTISKRFRKKRDIEDWHKTNELQPILISGLES